MLLRGTSKFAAVLQVAIMWLPWGIRRRLLNGLFGYSIAPDAKVGISIVLVERLIMATGARIGHANLIRDLVQLGMGPRSAIMSRNQVTGRVAPGAFPETRKSELLLGAGAAIVHHHIIDCADSVHIGDFTILAGYGSHIYTHDIDVLSYKFRTAPVNIGSHCYIGARTVLLQGTQLANRCVVGAGSVVRGAHFQEHSFLAGSPAKRIKSLPPTAVFFSQQV